MLHVEGNRFSGIIPTEIGKLSRLETLDMYDNPFEGGIVAHGADPAPVRDTIVAPSGARSCRL